MQSIWSQGSVPNITVKICTTYWTASFLFLLVCIMQHVLTYSCRKFT